MSKIGYYKGGEVGKEELGTFFAPNTAGIERVKPDAMFCTIPWVGSTENVAPVSACRSARGHLTRQPGKGGGMVLEISFADIADAQKLYEQLRGKPADLAADKRPEWQIAVDLARTEGPKLVDKIRASYDAWQRGRRR